MKTTILLLYAGTVGYYVVDGDYHHMQGKNYVEGDPEVVALVDTFSLGIECSAPNKPVSREVFQQAIQEGAEIVEIYWNW